MVIIDGHNRQRLCEQHGPPYQVAVFSFESMLEAKQWALDTQKGYRSGISALPVYVPAFKCNPLFTALLPKP